MTDNTPDLGAEADALAHETTPYDTSTATYTEDQLAELENATPEELATDPDQQQYVPLTAQEWIDTTARADLGAATGILPSGVAWQVYETDVDGVHTYVIEAYDPNGKVVDGTNYDRVETQDRDVFDAAYAKIIAEDNLSGFVNEKS